MSEGPSLQHREKAFLSGPAVFFQTKEDRIDVLAVSPCAGHHFDQVFKGGHSRADLPQFG